MLDLNKYRNIHCIGIGGIGLSAIAEILLSRGYSVSGSDMKESEMTDKLAKAARESLSVTEPRMWKMRICLYTRQRSARQPGTCARAGERNSCDEPRRDAGTPDG